MQPNLLRYNDCALHLASAPTGCYLYLPHIFEERVNSLIDSLPQCFEVFYSLKSNPHFSFIDKIKNKNRVGFDVSSIGELRNVLYSQPDTSNILFVGPGKRQDELELFMDRTEGYLVVESITELKLISKIANKLKKHVNILLRINPSYAVRGVKMAMGGKETQFGVMEDNIEIALEIIDSNSFMSFFGFHTYVGTRILSFEDCIHNITEAIKFSFTFHSNVRPIKVIDVGGGIGIPYFRSESEFDLVQFKKAIASALDQFPKSFINDIKIILEAGRFLSGPSGYFLTNVSEVTVENGHQYIYVDSSPSQFGLSSHSMRSDLVYKLGVLQKTQTSNQPISSSIIGNLSSHGGTFVTNVLLPNLQKNDIVYFENAGAYGLTAHNLQPYLLPKPEIFIQCMDIDFFYALAS